jgi:hypothetical protein
MTTNATAPAFRYIGITDGCVECQKCGKTELRSTVVLAVLDADGNTEDITYYGSTCAARALNVKGGGRAVLQSARWAQERTRTEAEDARRMLAFYGLPETGFPDDDTLRDATRAYIRQGNNASRHCREFNVRAGVLVLEMMLRKRRVLAEAALVGL